MGGGGGILPYFGDPKIILIDTGKYGENPIFANVVTLVNFLTEFQTDPPRVQNVARNRI